MLDRDIISRWSIYNEITVPVYCDLLDPTIYMNSGATARFHTINVDRSTIHKYLSDASSARDEQVGDWRVSRNAVLVLL